MWGILNAIVWIMMLVPVGMAAHLILTDDISMEEFIADLKDVMKE